MARITYNHLDSGKTYDIQVFEGLSGRIGTVIKKEAPSKDNDMKGSVLIEFIRPDKVYDKESNKLVPQEPKYQIWLMADYEIASYRELSRDMVTQRIGSAQTNVPDGELVSR